AVAADRAAPSRGGRGDRPLAAVPGRVGPARPAGPRRHRALRLRPGRLPPPSGQPARLGLAGERLRALAPRVEPGVPAGPRGVAGERRGDRRDRRGRTLRPVPRPVRPRVATRLVGLRPYDPPMTPGDDQPSTPTE